MGPFLFFSHKFYTLFGSKTNTKPYLPDDEIEADIEQEQTTSWNYNMEGSESIKPVVGMKRPIDSES